METKNKKEKDLLKFLLHGINNIDFKIFNQFKDYESDNELISYQESLILLFDLDNSIESLWFESINMNTDNGSNDPGGYYTINKGKITNKTPSSKVKKLIEMCDYLCDFYDTHLPNFKI